MFTESYSRFATHPAVITDTGLTVTYNELASLVANKAADLPAHVLQFCLCENSLESLVTYLACLEAGAPVVLVDGRKDAVLLDNLRRLYRPGETVCHKDLAVCLTTSGSTGSPKLVRLTLENLRSNAEAIAEYLGIDENERAVTMLPMYYSYGLSVINSHLLRGATLLMTGRTYAQREFWSFLKEEGATSMAGVPYTWEMLKRLRFFRMDLPSVRTMTQAGGKLNPDLALEYIRNAKACGKRFIVMYGQTEATARMSYLPWDRAEEKYDSIGVAIPGGTFSLGEDGELVYRGPNVSMGYAECAEDLMKGDENGGVLYTGDLARVDEDGFYYIVGRKKRFVKVWGNRCSLDAVEQLLKMDEAREFVKGSQLAVAGVDDCVTVFVTVPGLEEGIRSYLSEKTGLNSRAFVVRVLEGIPVRESGKIDYQGLQSLL